MFTDPITGDAVVDALSRLPVNLLDQPCLDHGFVKVLDCMPRLIPTDAVGCDFALADAARISYQKGTRKVSADAALIDHLIRNQHTSPIEMGELKFHIRLPIFVMRQHVRHRTASLNEESARYSELASDFYVPKPEHWAMNTTVNKQATIQYELDPKIAHRLYDWLKEHNDNSYGLYQALLSGINDEHGASGLKIPGIAREQARMVLGVNIYTQCVWKCDLKNLLNYLRLRTDKHAQFEIRVFADAIARVTEVLFPAAWASYKDHFIDGINLSKVELLILGGMLAGCHCARIAIENAGWSQRRFDEFAKKIRKNDFVSEAVIFETVNCAWPDRK